MEMAAREPLRAGEERQRSMAGFGEGEEHLLVDLTGRCRQPALAKRAVTNHWPGAGSGSRWLA
jgi:hypothetical protein